VDRADPDRVRSDEFGKLTALRPRIGETQAVRDTALENGEMVGQRQDGLHHVQIVHPRQIHIRQGGGEEIGLPLIVAFDRDAVAGPNDRFEQLGRPLGGTEVSACTAHRSGSRQPREAIGFVPGWV
jgi:hypothetical protein